VIALAATRTGAAALNHLIRQRLQQAELVGADQPAGETNYAVGELVMVTRNDHYRGLLNGQRGTITDVEPDHVTLEIEGQTITVPTGWANERLTAAYATTVHKAQGLTVEIALVDATGISDRNAGYVAFSRARDRTEIHHTNVDVLADALTDDALSPIREHGRGDRVAELAARLTHSHDQHLAIDQGPHWRSNATRDLGRAR
jgi:ATP-dependent exoDNAse (exonuclease V) alpha subunit